MTFAAGVGKALDLQGFAAVIDTYRPGLTERRLEAAALEITVLELALGTWLLTGGRLREAARLSLALNPGHFRLPRSAARVRPGILRTLHEYARSSFIEEVVSLDYAPGPGLG